MADTPDQNEKTPKRLRGVAGKQTDKRPRKRTAQLLKTKIGRAHV